MGLSVSRPARLAVSSPKKSAMAPWDTSCKMTEGTIVHTRRISNVVIRWVRMSTANSATPAMIQMVARGLRPCRRGPEAGGGPHALIGRPGSVFRGAVDAVPRGRLRLEAQRVDRRSAVFTGAVAAFRQLGEGPFDALE